MIPLYTGNKARKRGIDSPWLWNSEQISPEVQNKGISVPTQGVMASKNFFKEKKTSVMLMLKTVIVVQQFP